MAIIIQDMNMPAQCWECPFHFRLDNAHAACSRKPMEDPVEDGDERPKYCPLEELEEPFEEVLRKVQGRFKLMKKVEVRCLPSMKSADPTALQMLDIAREALREVSTETMKYGVGDGENVYIRYEIDKPRWFKIYVYKIGETTYIDGCLVSDEEVMAHGCSLS